jgi:beta-1,4-mannosyl-glycoprotein beta-1,4-N-acetylglucosaminyltransferase
MELSELDDDLKEVKRSRIPAPNGNGSYCEKNWMPILDMPYHYVKWCNPTEVVKVDPDNLTCETVYLGSERINLSHDLRGGSQVIPYGEYRLAITHQVDLFNSRLGRRDAVYRSRFVVWDKDWNLVRISEPFDFLGGHVEFVCGAAWSPGNKSLLVTFGYQDNSAFIVEIPKSYLDKLLQIDQPLMTSSPKSPRVIDYFQYFNEKELLELRINTLSPEVDQFVIAEANATFTGTPKEYTLMDTIRELGLPENKIKVIQVDYPDDLASLMQNIDVAYSKHECWDPRVLFWIRERLQRDALLSIIDEYGEDDVFIMTDCDEIIKPELIPTYSYQARNNRDKLIKIPMVSIEGRGDLRVYDLSGNPLQWDKGPYVCTKSHLLKYTPHQLRGNFFDDMEIVHITEGGKRIEDAGWHFSWMGGYQRLVQKASAFAHAKDAFDYVKFREYNTVEMVDFMQHYIAKEGAISPSGNKETLLKKYPTENLPHFVFKLPRVKEYLLPLHSELSREPVPVIGTAIVNGVHWLKRLISSIDYPVTNFVIINNNGRGELDGELDEIANKPHLWIGKIHICTPPGNIGCSGAWNLIIKSFLMSPYWVIANHDVCFEPGFLEEMVNKAQDPEVGMVHGGPGDRGDGMYDLFLIKDWVVQEFGLFDENFYPGYDEDVDYNVRLSKNPPKRILSVGVPYRHGDDDYATSGSQTWRVDESLKPKLYAAREMNESEYMVEKWGPNWPTSTYPHPFNDTNLPLSATTFNLEFARRKHLGF